MQMEIQVETQTSGMVKGYQHSPPDIKTTAKQI